MKRRRFIESSSTFVLLPIASLTVSANSPSNRPPEIPEDFLDSYDWEEHSANPELPQFEGSEHIENSRKTRWGMNAFHGTAVRDEIEEETPSESVDL
jgi:hypothetical protein